MKSIVLTVFLFLFISNLPVLSQFSGAYAPGNWTTTLSAGSNGSVNTSGAPASIVINGSDGVQTANADVDFTITTTTAGIWSFSWDYLTNDSDADPQYDIAGVLINGVFTQLTVNTAGLTSQSGTYLGTSVPIGTVIGFRLRATDNIFGDALLTITGFAPPSGTLPVNFSYFDAIKSSNAVLLKWGTASEALSDRFEIQRSADGSSFQRIGTVRAKGNSSVLTDYSTTDNAPLAGTNYYRIREVDTDGKELFTKTLIVNFAKAERSQVYPNPASTTTTLDLGSRKVGETLTVQLFSANGQLASSREWKSRTNGQNKMVWDISKLMPGIYFFKIKDEANNASAYTFVKN